MPPDSVSSVKPSAATAALALLLQTGPPLSLTNYQKNERIFVQGSSADHVFYLERGRVTLSVVSKQGKEAITSILTAGSFFGEGSLAGRTVHGETGTALADSTVLVFKKKQVLAAIRKNPDFAQFFTIYLLQRKARIEEDLVDQLFNSSEKRLARVLLLLTQFGKDEQTASTVVDVSQDTLARMVGTTRPRVSFFLNRFRRSGFIDYGNDGLRVHRSLLSRLLRD